LLAAQPFGTSNQYNNAEQQNRTEHP
jgi:hypothetical protein